jgi:hypothetical protein
MNTAFWRVRNLENICLENTQEMKVRKVTNLDVWKQITKTPANNRVGDVAA